MIGKVFFMELRTSWKGIVIFLLIVLLLAGGMPQMFPSVMESAEAGLPGEENLKLIMPANKKESILLSWEPVPNATFYFVLESEDVTIFPFNIVYFGSGTNTSIPYDFEGDRYYSVWGNMSGFANLSDINVSGFENIIDLKNIFEIFIGMTGTEQDETNAFDALLDNPAYQSMTGGGQVTTIYEIKGFISLEFFSWWILLGGLFLAYMSVSSITTDFEGKHMDLIFSTPISRERYLLEKFAALTLITLFILVVAAGAMAGGIANVGYGDDFDSYTVFLSLIGSLPMLLVVMAIGFLAAVLFRTTRVGMGLAFLFIMIQFILYTVAHLVTSLESAKYATIMEYWDYNTVMFDGLFKVGDFIGLFVVTAIILVLAVLVFKKKDIPA